MKWEQCNVLHHDRFNRRIGNQWICHHERLEVMRPYHGVQGQPGLTGFAGIPLKEERL